MTIASSVAKGDLVSVTLTYGAETFTAHGRLTGIRELAIEVLPTGGSYSSLPDEALRDGVGHLVTEWATIYSETGDPLPSPPGARGLWGSQAKDSTFRLTTSDWLLGMYDLKVRVNSSVVAIEPITEEGRKWIAANLSTDKRRARLEDKLFALDPELVKELDDVLYRAEQDARADERRIAAEY